MKMIKELNVFIDHYDWYRSDENGFFIPTESAPPEAVKAIEYCNSLVKKTKRTICILSNYPLPFVRAVFLCPKYSFYTAVDEVSLTGKPQFF